MKRITSILLISLLVICSAFASDFGFELGEIQFTGKLPTLVTAGVNYKGLQLTEDNTTELILIAGGGKAEREYYPTIDASCSPISPKYTTGLVDFTFKQGFKEDLVTLSAGIKAGFEKFNYPDRCDDDKLENSLKFAILSAGFSYNGTDEKAPVRDGFNAFVNLQFAPSILSLNWNIDPDDGEQLTDLSFAGIEAQLVYSKTLFERKRDNGLNKFSATLIDRANVSYVQLLGKEDYPFLMLNSWKPYSVTEKVRGYNCYTQSIGNFAAVNNFEVRFALPELKDGLFARLILFADAGVTMGYSLLDTTTSIEPAFISSFGGQLTLNLLDILDLGIEVAFPTPREEFAEKKYVTNIVFGLKY